LRLYCKLFALIAIAIAIQQYVLEGSTLAGICFALRCHHAYNAHDDRMVDRLVEEERHRVYHPDEEFFVSAD